MKDPELGDWTLFPTAQAFSSTSKRFWRRGEPQVWATAAALATMLVLVILLLAVVLVEGLGVLWPAASWKSRWPTAARCSANVSAAK